MRTSLVALLLVSGCITADIPDLELEEEVSELNGDTWTTIDDFRYNGSQDASYAAVAVSPTSKRAFAVGWFSELGGTTWQVRRSNTSGTNFQNSTKYRLTPSGSSEARAVEVDAQGRIYVVGHAEDASGRLHWIVRRSIDDGLTWQTVDDFIPDTAPGHAMAASITITDTLGIYVGGGSVVDGQPGTWVVRRSAAGTTWSTIDSVAGALGQAPLNHIAAGMCTKADHIYAVGVRVTGAMTNDWITRRMTSGAWSTVDQFAVGMFNGANGCSVTTSGTQLVVGSALSPSRFRIRRSTNGTTWATVLDALGAAITATSTPSRTYVGGHDQTTGVSRWFVRRTTDDGATWVDSDDYALAIGQAASARGSRYTATTGRTYMVGDALDANGARHAIIRVR